MGKAGELFAGGVGGDLGDDRVLDCLVAAPGPCRGSVRVMLRVYCETKGKSRAAVVEPTGRGPVLMEECFARMFGGLGADWTALACAGAAR